MNETIEYIKMPNWQTVMDGRPLIVVYHPERFRAALQVAKGKEHMTGAEFVGYVRARVEAEGLKNPYIVGCMEPRDSFLHAKILKKEGYDAFMDYEGAYGGRLQKGRSTHLCGGHGGDSQDLRARVFEPWTPVPSSLPQHVLSVATRL